MRPRKMDAPKVPEVRENHSDSFGLFFRAKKVLYKGKSRYQQIEIIENEDYGRVLFLDGLVQTTDQDEFYYHEMLVHPALCSHPGPRDVLIIGGGDGGALREVLRHPVRRVWLVEIDKEVIEACKKFFPWLGPALADQRTRLEITDGIRFIRETSERFDVVLIDSSDPVGPSTPLHQQGFYELLKKRLRPGGAAVAQAGSLRYHLREHQVKSEFLRQIFRNVSFYIGPAPTYPGGTWCYVFVSDRLDPKKKPLKAPPPGLRYYNGDIHGAAFALPNFLRQVLD